ncbi:MAG: DUF418 domain-containing protein [Phycisphaerales bacterium]
MISTPAQQPVSNLPAPVPAEQRVQALDVLRGLALLGILVPNMLWFAWPQAGAVSAESMAAVARRIEGTDAAGHHTANAAGFFIIDVFFLGKFMFLFATLFGAGIVLFDRKFHTPGVPAPLSRGAKLWYVRMGWLLVFGLFHAFGMWFGDILTWYAIAGLGFVWWVRRWRIPTLLAGAAASYLLGTAVMLLLLFFSEIAIRSGTLSPEQMWGGDGVREFAIYACGSYLDMVQHRVGLLLSLYAVMPFTFFWQVSGLMMLGLALARLGVYTGQRSVRFYAAMAAVGIPLGIATTLGGRWIIRQFHSPIESVYWLDLAQLCGFPTALGYAGLVLVLVRASIARPLTGALAAVGRMALSNYLLQTLLCTIFFYSIGLGYFARIQFPGLWLVVVTLWCINVVFSMIWLRFFRFGPAEWLWRSLTYRRLQPMLRSARSAVHLHQHA